MEKSQFGLYVKVWSQKREESPTVKRQPVYNFLKRTINKEDVEKQRVKNYTESFIYNYFLKLRVGRIKLLTLPGVTWKWERSLKRRFAVEEDFRIKTSFTGCEIDYKVFCLSVANMPSKTGIQPYFSDRLGVYVAGNSKLQISILNADIFDIMHRSSEKGKYNCVWLDTTHTVVSVVRKIGDSFADNLTDDAIIILTVLKGREHLKFETNRTDFVANRLKDFGFTLASTKEYFDTCPMLHLIFTRK